MEKNWLADWIEEHTSQLQEYAMDVWAHPEIAGNESHASDLARRILTEQGFTVVDTPGVPHAFYAEYGSGGPVLAVLGEYDALPNLSQRAGCTERDVLVAGGPGHGCGHNLLGMAALGAALALRSYLEESGKPGRVRFYGCPAEETLSGKVEMIEAGAFAGCDAALSWHPLSFNAAFDGAFLANNSMKFRFSGLSAHASAAPEAGRSALDAVELMNVGANYLREHVVDAARIHYTITNAGGAPNIIPAEAESWYYVRAPHRKDVAEITERLIKVAQGAAMMTETTVEHELICGCYEALPNRVMMRLTSQAMKDMPLPVYSDEELAFARSLQETIKADTLEKERDKIGPGAEAAMQDRVMEPQDACRMTLTASSDSGDVSWLMPMNLFIGAAWPIGTPPHSWQATSASGSPLGVKNALYAAKVLAAVGYDLFTQPEVLAEAKAEFSERTKNGGYVSPLAGRRSK